MGKNRRSIRCRCKNIWVNEILKSQYRFRVDNIHMETYKMLGGLHRNGLQGETEIELIMPKEDEEED